MQKREGGFHRIEEKQRRRNQPNDKYFIFRENIINWAKLSFVKMG